LTSYELGRVDARNLGKCDPITDIGSNTKAPALTAASRLRRDPHRGNRKPVRDRSERQSEADFSSATLGD
jgi:hypothetical protein